MTTARAFRACPMPGCAFYQPCPKHRRLLGSKPPRGRPGSTERGYDYRHQLNRRLYLRRYPQCVICGRAATDLDHVVPLAQGGQDVESNWQALCHRCHARKTARQSGGAFRRRDDPA